VPAMYVAIPVNERVSAGLAINSPFGLTTKPENPNWAGKFEARTSELRTYNFNPVVSYKLTDQLAVAGGLQVEYIRTTLKSAFPGIGGLSGPNPSTTIKDADDLDVGYTLGLLWQSASGTDIGIGFRSSIEHELEGDLLVAGTPALGKAGVSAGLETPEIVTASLRQKLGERTTLLGTVEWTNWSRLGLVQIRSRSVNPALGAPAVGSVVTELPLYWDDGWFYSGGIEYEHNERMTFRAGAAYEQSPIQSASQRTPRSPDTNRIWAAIGATYQFNESTSFDIAYSHTFFEDGTINRTSPIGDIGQVRFLGDVQQNVDIVAVSIKVKLGSEPPAESPMLK
jgi:long-chain fatty acid transport protein